MLHLQTYKKPKIRTLVDTNTYEDKELMTMQIVINIDEKDYNFIKKQVADGIINPLKICIANGTPLPKGHGRIADMDEAIKCIGEVEGEDAVWAIALIEWACSKRTLIEADKSKSEDKNDR